MLKRGDRIGLVGCSNAQPEAERAKVQQLAEVLREMGLVPVTSGCLYARQSIFSGTAEERAQEVNRFYADGSIKAVFDLSGGDVANGVLEYLDYEQIRRNPKPFWGYSDLTTVLNAIFAKTGQASYLYQIKNLIWERTGTQTHEFREAVLGKHTELFDMEWELLRGSAMRGTAVGGNIRCLLKLAGTPYLPNFAGKLLFLESYGGGAHQMSTYFYQLRQMGVFRQVSGILLGTFTAMEERGEAPTAAELLLRITADTGLPIAKTQQVGHACTSKCLVIGKEYAIEKDCGNTAD